MGENDRKSQAELKRLRGLSGNTRCADCDRQDSSWSSVSLGVFICVTCSDVHRSVGTHISKVKGCTGTYLWGPDELEKMASVGNRAANELYGTQKVDPSASKEQKQRYVCEKYDKRSFLNKSALAAVESCTREQRPESPGCGREQKHSRKDTESIDVQADAKPTRQCSITKAATTPAASRVPDSLFDELFNEMDDSYFGSAALKPSAANIVQPLTKDSFVNDSDIFFGAAFQPMNQTVQTEKSSYALDFDPFAITVTAAPQQLSSTTKDALDFSDWPEF